MLNFFKNVNKWFYAFLGTTLALIAAVVVAVVLGVGANNDAPPVIQPSEGPETGIYYYDLEMGELQLSLNSGNQFSLTGPGYNASGVYTVNGSDIALDFLKDEDGTATAIIDGDTLKVTLGESVMTFLKKVSYIVSYHSNGGSIIADAYVVNGKPADKPADPTKDGFAFLGWYADEELKTPFDFITTLITADTTIYARWVEKVANRVEYTATFDLGYEGAEALPEVTTIGGKLYNLASPTRDGYNFEGWFISTYGESDKLTYQYTEDITLTENTTLFAIWSVAGTDKLPAPNVSVTATSIKWNSVIGASAYKLKVTDPEGSVLYDETLGATTKNINFEQFAAGDFTIEVTAVSNKSENNSEAAVRYFRNKALDRVSNFTVVDGILIFNAVRNAEKYLITVECGNPGHNHALYDNGKSTNFNFSNCTMQKGGIKFTVTAVAEGYAESISKTFAYERALDPVVSIIYDKAEDAFIWDSVPFAAYYTVIITSGGESYTFNKVMEYTFALGNYSGDISIEVIPVTEGYLSPDATKATCQKTAPAIPQGLVANNTVLSWKDNGATSYEVKINDKVFTVSEPKFDLATADGLSLNVGELYDISVRAIKDGEGSAYCAPIKVGNYKLAPTLTYQNNTVYWSPVLGCSNFEVRVNGGQAVAISGANYAKVTLTKSGINVIEVRCTDLDNSDWVALQVTAYAITYMSRTSLGEITEYLAVGDTITLPSNMQQDGFTFDGWYNVPDGAEGNGKEFSDTVFNGSNSMVLFANWKANEYKIIFNVDPDQVTDIENGSSQTVVFNKPFTLPVPTITNGESGIFKGWYTDAYGKGTQITNDEGICFAPYTNIGDLNVYPFIDAASDVLAYELLPDGTYTVKGGPKVNSVAKIRIPVTYQGVEITEISDNAFLGCSSLKSISLPDTIRHIGVGAFDDCSKLESFDVYVAKDGTYEVFYASADGALLYFDKASGNNYLEIFPRAKTGTYTITDKVDTIRPYAFNNSKITKVVISTTVTQISESAFYNCSALETIEFAPGREANVTIHANAFHGLSKVTMLKLPALITPFDASMSVLNSLPALTTILVEEGSTVYTAVENYLCDANPAGLTILYVPQTIRGEFKAPMGISGIGNNVFQGNRDITSVVIPAYINSIGSNAFSDCANLTSFVVEEGRNSDLTIGSNAFASCNKLSVVEFAGGAKSRGAITVGDSAFTGCTSLTTFKVGSGVNVASIGNNAFKNDTQLSTIEVHDDATLSQIGNNAFEKCSSLETFAVHKTTAYIGNSAFKNCSSLLTFSFGESVTPVSFGTSVFTGCSILKTIKLPKTLTAFDGSVFNDCISLESIEVDAANPNLQSKNGVLYTKGLTEILFYPKNQDGDLTKLPWDTLQKIGAGVFKNNQRIEAVQLGANIAEIGEAAFYGCTKLTSVSYDKNNKQAMTVGNQAFYGCTKLASASLPMTTTVIGSEAFYNTVISSFTLPSSLTTIGTKTFANTSLSSITIPATVTFIGNGAFSGASKLTSVIFNEGTAPLMIGTTSAVSGEGAFEGTALTGVDLPKNLTSIGSYAFANIATLQKAVVPTGASLTEVGTSAFYGCTKLAYFNFVSGLSTIGDSAFEGTRFTSISLPGSLTYIGINAFKSAPLTSVIMANGPEGASLEIGEGAFAKTSFESIKLPSHLTMLGAYNELYNYYTVDAVFDGNTVLKSIEVDAGNRIYRAQNGILYLSSVAEQSDALLLVYCPRAKTGVVTIPKTVYMVGAKAFFETKLTAIRFEEFDKNDPNYGKPLLTIGSFNTVSSNGAAYATIGSNVGTVTSLTYIKFPSHLDTVNSYAMYNLNKAGAPKDGSPEPQAQLMIEFNPDASPVSFKNYAISNNTALKSLSLPLVKDMGASAFGGNNNMISLSLPVDSPMTLISSNAFSNNKLTSFTVPNNVQTIEEKAFSGCRQLASFDWGNSQVTYIGNKAFGYTSFESFKIADSVTVVGTSLFEYSTTLKAVELSRGMTTLFADKESIFTNCNSIQSVTLPDGDAQMKKDAYGIIYSLDGKTLYYCPSNIQYEGILQLPEGVETIEVGAFNKFQGKLIKLPSTLKTINTSAFRDCSLEMIIFPASLETIGDYAFHSNGTSQLSTIAFEGNKLRSIGYQAFYGSKITGLNIPEGTTSIGYQAFGSCTKLTSAVLPGSLQTIADQIFVSCSNLKNVTINEGVQSIPARMFRNCKSLTTISIPDSVTFIGDYAFASCSNLETVYFSSNSRLTSVGNSLFSSCSNLKTIIFGDKLSSLGTNMFQGCTKLTEVRLPNAMSRIPDSLFANCADLASVNIPTSITTIGASAFLNCVNLTEIQISNKISSIGANAFAGCTNLERVVFADGCKLKTMAAGVFDGDVKLAFINVPSTVTSVGNAAFRNTAISEFDFRNVSSVGNEAFSGCSNLKAAVFTTTIRTIGTEAFANCTSLETVNLATGLTSIGELAFENCVSVKAFNIPATLTTLNGNPFSNCTGVTQFTVDSANKSFIYSKGALFDKTGFTLIYYSAANTADTYILPDSVHEILSGAFAGSQLKSFEIPATNNISIIPTNAFRGSKYLTSIIIPATIKEIGDYAFEGCVALTNVYIPESVNKIGHSAFANCTALTTVALADRNTSFTSVGANLFDNCVKLTSVVPFQGITYLTDHMYRNTGIVNAVIPEWVTDISATGVFEDCKSLKTVTFPATGKNVSIGSYFFYNCTALETVTLPPYIDHIGIYAFMNCENLTSVVFNGTVSNIGTSSFENCSKLITVTYAAGYPNLVGFGERSFANCSSLTSIELLTYCDRLPTEVFLGCASLTGSLQTAKKFTEMANYALSGTGITEIRFNIIELYVGEFAFSNLAENTVIIFETLTETQARKSFGAALDNSNATFVFAEEGDVSDVELSAAEIAGIEKLCSKMPELKGKADIMKKALLDFKIAGYLSNVLSAELTKLEVTFIDETLNKLALTGNAFESMKKEFQNRLKNYKQSILDTKPEPDPEPSVELTKEEISGIEKLCAEIRELTGCEDALKKAMIEFKKAGYLDKVTSPEVTDAELKFIQSAINSLGLATDVSENLLKDFQLRLQTYKKTLMMG